MSASGITRKRVLAAILVGWLGVIGFDFFLHGGLLAHLYIEPSDFLLPPETAFRLIPLGYLSFLLFQAFLVWVMVRTGDITGKQGACTGLKVGAFAWGSLALGLLSISTVGVPLMMGWFVGQTVEAALGGFIAGRTMETQHPGRVALGIFGLVVLLIAGTILLQSFGVVPTMKLPAK